MPQYNLGFDKSVGPTGGVQHNNTAAVTYGDRFTVPVDGFITQLWFYNPYTPPNGVPQNIALWNVNTGQRVAFKSPPDTQAGGSGWEYTDLPSPVWAEAGHTLIVSYYHPAAGGLGHYITRIPVANLTSPTGGITWHSSCEAWALGDNYPGGTGNTVFYPLDITFDTDYTPNPTTPATVGSTRNELASWLDEDDFTEPDSMVALAWALLQTMDTLLHEVETKVDTVDALLETALGPVGNLATGALRGFIDNLQSMIEDVQDAVGPYINNHTTAAKTEILTAIDNIPTGGGGGLPAGPVSVANGWTLREFITGTGKIKWDEPADAYILVRTGWDADRALNTYEGVNYFFDRGWWSPQQDDVIEGYGTLAASTHLLRVPTGRMSGVLIVQDDDFEWELQAWDAPV